MRPGGASRTLEVRWIGEGPIPDAMFGWLGPFDDWIERREDRYLVEPAVPELGVKIKGGIELDLKAFRGSPGELEVPGGGLGRLEVWEKWRFPLDTVALPPIDGSGWLAIRKTRRRRSFHLVGDQVVERPIAEAELPGCSVELTDFTVDGETWWTLALEAGGDPDSLERELRATAESLFRGPLPEGLRLDLWDSVSYARWFSSGGGRRPESSTER
jgi:hypothetical protein